MPERNSIYVEIYQGLYVLYMNRMDREGYIMLAAVKGYYDGTQIVLNEDDRKNLNT